MMAHAAERVRFKFELYLILLISTTHLEMEQFTLSIALLVLHSGQSTTEKDRIKAFQILRKNYLACKIYF